MTADALPAAELRRRTLHGLRWTMIGRPSTELVLLGSMVVLSRLVSPADFGRYAIAALVSDFATIPANGVSADIVRRPTITREHLQSGLALTLLTGAAFVAITLLAAGTIIAPIFGGGTADLVRLSSPACFLAGLSAVPSAVLQRNLAFRRLAVMDVSTSVVRAVVAIGLAVVGLKGGALVLGGLAGWVAATGLACAWARPPLPRLHRAAARDILAYALPASLAAVSWVGFRNCDYAIVGARLGALQAGLYFRAYTLGVEYQKKVSQVMGTVGFSVLARTQSGDDMDALRGQMVRLLTVVLFPLLALLAVVAPVFLPWLFGQAWAPAVIPTQILAVGGAATLVIDAVGATLMASGRPRALLGFGWAHFLTYGLAVLAVAPLGLDAVASAAAVVHGAFLLVAYALMLHRPGEHPLRQLWRDVAPATLSCAVLVATAVPASLALSAAGAPAIPYLAGVGLLAGGTYLATLRICFPDAWGGLATLVGHLLPYDRLRGAVRRLSPASRRATT